MAGTAVISMPPPRKPTNDTTRKDHTVKHMPDSNTTVVMAEDVRIIGKYDNQIIQSASKLGYGTEADGFGPSE